MYLGKDLVNWIREGKNIAITSIGPIARQTLPNWQVFGQMKRDSTTLSSHHSTFAKTSVPEEKDETLKDWKVATQCRGSGSHLTAPRCSSSWCSSSRNIASVSFFTESKASTDSCPSDKTSANLNAAITKAVRHMVSAAMSCPRAF